MRRGLSHGTNPESACADVGPFQKFLRSTPVASLRAYLERISPDFQEVNWRAPTSTRVNDLLQRIVSLESNLCNRVYADVDQIGQFLNDHGRKMLRSVLVSEPDALSEFDALEDVTACALFVLTRSAQ